jgi:hypothetical protein
LLIQGSEGTQSNVADLDINQLLLAANCISHNKAAAAAAYMPSHLKPHTAQKLLLTAVARQHTRLWELLLSSRRLPHVQQHIDAATCEKAFELAMMHEGKDVEQCVIRIA